MKFKSYRSNTFVSVNVRKPTSQNFGRISSSDDRDLINLIDQSLITKKFISIVVPAYNEALNIRRTVAHLEKICHQLEKNYDFEIIVVNDGSIDDTRRILDQLAYDSKNLYAVHLSRNFGHQSAIICGMNHATGDAVFMLDADGEHPPDSLIDALKEWEAGFKIVNIKRRTPQKKILGLQFSVYTLLSLAQFYF